VRLVFVVLTFVHLLGPLAYGSLWLVIPRRPGDESLLEQFLKHARDLASMLGGRRNEPPGPGSGIRPSAISNRL